MDHTARSFRAINIFQTAKGSVLGRTTHCLAYRRVSAIVRSCLSSALRQSLQGYLRIKIMGNAQVSAWHESSLDSKLIQQSR